MSETSPVLDISVGKLFSGFSLDVSFSVPAGITMLFGASGSGKTSVLNCVAGLLRPDRGTIRLNSDKLFDSQDGTDLPVQRRNIGYVFQDLALFPHLSVEENAGYGLFSMAARDREARVGQVLEAFRIGHLRRSKPNNISGGEQQRVALARALVTDPKALLLDEPLSALDPATKSHIMDDLRDWIRQRRIPVMYVTHSRDEVLALGDRVVAMEKGRIVGEGLPAEVLRAHQHEAVAAWSGLQNIFEGRVVAHHEPQGTMTVRTGEVELEVLLGRKAVGERAVVGISANDVILATAEPLGLSARNVIPGKIIAIEQKSMVAVVSVECGGVKFLAHLTPGAVQSLALTVGAPTWVIVKTHSCFLLAK